jgi:hypothetical protein
MEKATVSLLVLIVEALESYINTIVDTQRVEAPALLVNLTPEVYSWDDEDEDEEDDDDDEYDEDEDDDWDDEDEDDYEDEDEGDEY